MDTQVLAQEFMANCLAPAAADEGTHEGASQLEDGRTLLVAACPPAGSAAFAVELDLGGVEKDAEGELELGMLEAVWNYRLGDGFVMAREGGKDFLALVAHRSTAAAPELAASMGRLLAAAADPVAQPESGGEPAASGAGWVQV